MCCILSLKHTLHNRLLFEWTEVALPCIPARVRCACEGHSPPCTACRFSQTYPMHTCFGAQLQSALHRLQAPQLTHCIHASEHSCKAACTTYRFSKLTPSTHASEHRCKVVLRRRHKRRPETVRQRQRRGAQRIGPQLVWGGHACQGGQGREHWRDGRQYRCAWGESAAQLGRKNSLCCVGRGPDVPLCLCPIPSAPGHMLLRHGMWTCMAFRLQGIECKHPCG